MTEVAARARAAGLRAVVAETQNTNVRAIRFYRRVGFTLEGIDISYYTNEDMQPDRTVALFMKLRLT
jgi:ribosomal protein S18 acetylase RimI-like enzyme